MKAYQNKIAFWGTINFSATILEALHQEYKNIVVITPTDKKAGRGQKIQESPTKQKAQELSLPILQPETIDDNFFNQFKKYNFDLSIIVAYGAIIPKTFIENPTYKTINIHASLLPKYRGASPVQTAILNGEEQTGVTLMRVDEKMDHGHIIDKQTLQIQKHETTQSLLEKMTPIAISLLQKNLPLIFSGTQSETPQDHSGATYTKIIKKEDRKIDWNTPAIEIDRKCRAFTNDSGIFTFINNSRVKIIECEATNQMPQKSQKPGTIILHQENNKKEMGVITKQGILIIKKIHLENKKLISGEIFIATRKHFIGQTFS